MPQQLRATPDLLVRIRGEFLEMPGLRVTSPQAQRLWGLDSVACAAILACLVDEGFLRCTPNGAFARRDCDTPRRWTAVA